MAAATVYSTKAFATTSLLKARIAQVARILNLNPEAIYGAMVEENHSYQAGMLKNMLGDVWTLAHAQSHASLLAEYQRAQAQNKLDRHSTWDKFNPVLNDIGPYNYKLATAIRFLQDYLHNTPVAEDPLNLRRYANDYANLAHDLASGEITPEFAGLMLSEAKRYMQQHADPEYWNPLSTTVKDAIYLTYYNMGPVVIEEKRQLQLGQRGTYKPEPGDAAAAGADHIQNATKIGQVFDHPDYSTPASSAQLSAPTTNAHDRVLRAPSANFVRYHNNLVAELKPGGSLSDIVAIERARGNLITIGDLRAVNQLEAAQERRLPSGYQLLIPQKAGATLRAEDQQTRLAILPADGSLSLQFTAADGSVMSCKRRWDAGQARFMDDYQDTDASGATRQAQHEVAEHYVHRLHDAYQPLQCQHITVSSSNIDSIGYSELDQLLSVRFHNGRLYEYYLVPRSCFDDFMAAPSKGKFLHCCIKGIYPYARIGINPYQGQVGE